MPRADQDHTVKMRGESPRSVATRLPPPLSPAHTGEGDAHRMRRWVSRSECDRPDLSLVPHPASESRAAAWQQNAHTTP
jgi:hypothetical protein